MSDDVITVMDSTAQAPPARPLPARSFVSHARAIGFITFISRLLGLARESIAANFFGPGAVWSAFTVAFTIPNLFRKLFGEGALSAAFIPLYAQAVKRAPQPPLPLGGEGRGEGKNSANQTPPIHRVSPLTPSLSPRGQREMSAADFAAASVNLLCAILLGITIIGELILWSLTLIDLRPDYLLAVKLTAIMLPYVLLVCGTAFLGAILQVHHRFIAITATAIVLNLCLIIAIVAAARAFDLRTEPGQIAAARWLAVSVLVAGVVQVAMLLPSLRAAGFRFRLILHLWTPAIRKMLVLSLPVALGAGVLQISVLLDKGISFLLAQGAGQTHFELFGWTIRYPMAQGAAARLNWAQFMYQFPLGVFAIALATAIFPRLSADAVDGEKSQDQRYKKQTKLKLQESKSQTRSTRGLVFGIWNLFVSCILKFEISPDARHVPDDFKRVLRHGIEAALFIGLPASIGMIVVRYPAVQLLFERGNFTAQDTRWVALSTAIYSSAIWAFSLQQILNRAYYALHDTLTPLIWGVVNLLLNLIIELPLLWTGLGESAMPVGTLVSFAVQSVMMLWMLDHRIGGMNLRASLVPIAKMVAAAGVMWIACIAVQWLPIYPQGAGKLICGVQLLILMTAGAVVYFAACAALGLATPMHAIFKSARSSRP